jgi:FAD/FMN-containing dehydrogenase
MTTETHRVAVDPEAIAALKGRLRGELLLPGEAAYDAARSIWNAMIDRRPALIARCLGVADVVACVQFARERGIALSVKGGGHNIAGLAVCDGGLMLDMSPMRGVWVDVPGRIARAQAGCLLGDVDRETQLHGLAAVLGFVSNTGIAGLTLGGGFGYLTRRFGWTCDNVRSMEVVTAEGRIVRASESENADLFWGLRGGGGNFGVVTSFEYTLYPVGPEIMGGAIAWRAEDAAEVLKLYRRIAEQAPTELTLVAAMRLAPPAPWLPKEIHGKPIILLVVCDTGPMAEAAARVAPIKAFGKPVGDVVQPRPYTVQQTLLDATQPKGRRYYWKSEYLPRLSDELFAGAIDHAAKIVSPHSAVIFFALDGALNRVPESASPAGNRQTASVLNLAGSWERAEDDAANIEWARAAWRDLRRFSTGGTYVNFLNADEGDDRTHDAYGAHYDRLVEIKTKWDPGNLFRTNKNIAPRV